MPKVYIVTPAGEDPQLYVDLTYVTAQENMLTQHAFESMASELAAALDCKPIKVAVPLEWDAADAIAEQRVRTNLAPAFNTKTDSTLAPLNGQAFTLIGLDPGFEKIEPNTPPLWRIKLADGREISAYEDEITLAR